MFSGALLLAPVCSVRERRHPRRREMVVEWKDRTKCECIISRPYFNKRPFGSGPFDLVISLSGRSESQQRWRTIGNKFCAQAAKPFALCLEKMMLLCAVCARYRRYMDGIVRVLLVSPCGKSQQSVLLF